MIRNAPRRPATPLPAALPRLHLEEPRLSVAGVFNAALPPAKKYSIGNPASPGPTLRCILRATYCRDSLQRLLYAGRSWWVWAAEVPSWQPMALEDLEAFLYRALRDYGLSATPKHVANLVRVAKLELRYPAPTMRCAG